MDADRGCSMGNRLLGGGRQATCGGKASGRCGGSNRHAGDLREQRCEQRTEHGSPPPFRWPGCLAVRPVGFACRPHARVGLVDVEAGYLECHREVPALGLGCGLCQGGGPHVPDERCQLPIDRVPAVWLLSGEETIEILVTQTPRVSHLMAVSAEVAQRVDTAFAISFRIAARPRRCRALTEFGFLPTTRATSSTVSPVTIRSMRTAR